MGRPISIISAKNFAQSVLEENGLLELPVDIVSLADKKDIHIDVMPPELAKRSIYGAVSVKNDAITILYSTLIDNMGFQNFTIAHELGHYFLEGHFEEVLDVNGLHISDSDFCSKSPYEVEADHFAAGLLMPEKLCKKLVAQFPDGIDGIKALAKETWSSLTAAAIRYIDLTTAPSAIVISSGGSVEYTVPTREVVKLGSFPYRGSSIPSASLTAKFSKACPLMQEATDSGEMESDLSLWIGGRKSIPCIEQVLRLGRTGKVLTVLTCHELDEEEDERDNDDAFEKRWGLQFR